MVNERWIQNCSVKKAFIKISQNSQENTCAKVSFSVKCSLQLYWKGNRNRSVFVSTLPIFQEHFFYGTPPVVASVTFNGPDAH